MALSAFAVGAMLTSAEAQQTEPSARMYRQAAAGWLEREVYRSPGDGKVPVEFVDVLLGAGRAALVKEMPTGALLDVKAGAAVVTVDKKPQRIAPGVVIRIDQGQALSIDNRKGDQAFVARLIRIASPR
jgi:hypothetical protein